MSRGTELPFRLALIEAIETSKLSRERIACEIVEQTGRNFSKTMLDKYTSSSLEYSFPSELLPTFCQITGCDKPLRVLLEVMGYGMQTPITEDLLKIERLRTEQGRITAKIRRLAIKNGLRLE